MIRFERDGSFTLIHGNCREPHIQWNHIDGPLLIQCDGQPHWLSWRERFLLRFGFTDAKHLDPSYCGDEQ
jgi:hypothetical protein